MQTGTKLRTFLFLGLGALCAGFLNGFLGAGGGIMLYFTLGALYGRDAKENLMTAAASVMFFCLVSLFFYKGGSALSLSDILKICIPSVIGGAGGALLLRRLPQTAVKRIFSAVLILGGILMLVR